MKAEMRGVSELWTRSERPYSLAVKGWLSLCQDSERNELINRNLWAAPMGASNWLGKTSKGVVFAEVRKQINFCERDHFRVYNLVGLFWNVDMLCLFLSSLIFKYLPLERSSLGLFPPSNSQPRIFATLYTLSPLHPLQTSSPIPNTPLKWLLSKSWLISVFLNSMLSSLSLISLKAPFNIVDHLLLEFPRDYGFLVFLLTGSSFSVSFLDNQVLGCLRTLPSDCPSSLPRWLHTGPSL